MKKIQKKRKGFTLAELVVVVTILGILMLIAVTRFSSVSDSANKKTFEANHRVAVSAIQMYMADNAGSKPDAAQKFDKYIGTANTADVGLDAIKGKPKGANYVWDGTNLTSTYGEFVGDKALVYTP